MSKILVIEDELAIAEIILAFLQAAGYETDRAADGMEGLNKFRNEKFDLILLDILLPKLSGYKVLEAVRRESDVPVIMLTALDDEESQMKGFVLQADDYITKPFSMPLVLKRIEAVLRRTNGQDMKESFLCYKGLRMDAEGYDITVDGRKVTLTSREFDLLKLFLENRGRVFTREQILSRIWDYDFEGGEKVINTHIKNIRKKLGFECIETVRGVGYKIGK